MESFVFAVFAWYQGMYIQKILAVLYIFERTYTEVTLLKITWQENSPQIDPAIKKTKISNKKNIRGLCLAI